MVISKSSRTGDFNKEKEDHMSAVPDISKIKLTNNHQFAVLASDGVWDVFPYDDAADFVMEEKKKGKVNIHTYIYFANDNDNPEILLFSPRFFFYIYKNL